MTCLNSNLDQLELPALKAVAQIRKQTTRRSFCISPTSLLLSLL
jgi:hypothetical protein